MQFLQKSIIAFIILLGLITFSQAETSWITKKKDKKDKVEKIETVENTTNTWIKKKEIKENKEKVKEKIKESKSWITKKSKEKKKEIKNKLKKHKNIDELPESEFYFAAIIEPLNDEDPEFIYGYVQSDKNSELVTLNNKSYYSLSNGIAYFENKKNICEVDSLLTLRRSGLSGDVIINCKKNYTMSGGYVQVGSVGRGFGETSNGNFVQFEFFSEKSAMIAKFEEFKDSATLYADSKNEIGQEKLNLKVSGKYYALLIGNSNYTNWASLTSPVNDVKEIGKILKNKYKFSKVFTVEDANRKEIFKKLKQLSDISTDNDYVLIYYSGHGDERANQRYWIPVDGEKSFGFGDWININDIQVFIQNEISNRHLVMMSDSCYFAMDTKGNQINRGKKSEAYQKLLDRRAVIIVGSGSNEPVEDTSQDKHSMFGFSFIQSLKNNNSAIRMRDIVENIILAHSGMQQQPYGIGIGAWGHGNGDFIFIAKN